LSGGQKSGKTHAALLLAWGYSQVGYTVAVLSANGSRGAATLRKLPRLSVPEILLSIKHRWLLNVALKLLKSVKLGNVLIFSGDLAHQMARILQRDSLDVLVVDVDYPTDELIDLVTIARKQFQGLSVIWTTVQFR